MTTRLNFFRIVWKGLFAASMLLGAMGALSEEKGNPIVLMKTTDGDITIELFADKSPVTVENFLSYVDEGHYDGTVFHRIIPNFMIQGGGFTEALEEKPTKQPIVNEEADEFMEICPVGSFTLEKKPDGQLSQDLEPVIPV